MQGQSPFSLPRGLLLLTSLPPSPLSSPQMSPSFCPPVAPDFRVPSVPIAPRPTSSPQAKAHRCVGLVPGWRVWGLSDKSHLHPEVCPMPVSYTEPPGELLKQRDLRLTSGESSRATWVRAEESMQLLKLPLWQWKKYISTFHSTCTVSSKLYL